MNSDQNKEEEKTPLYSQYYVGKPYHLWHSKEQEKVAGYCFYKLETGEEVKITTASYTSDIPNANFSDFKYLGIGVFSRLGKNMFEPYWRIENIETFG